MQCVGMARIARLNSRLDFTAVYSEGKSWSTEILLLRALPNDLGLNRYGFAVGKRVGCAVARNRVKRRMREAVRNTPSKQGWDMVFVARRTAATASYGNILIAVSSVLERAKLLENTEERD